MKIPILSLIPSAYKTSKVYSVLPVNGDGDFTFSRNSNGTRVQENGLIENKNNNVPRLDWLNSNCPSLLLEPQRTNEIIWSENFTQWVKSNLTVISGQITSPDGGLNSYKILETAVNNFHYAYSNVITYPNAVTYNYSVFVKKLGRQYVGIQTLFNTVTGAVALFDLDTGSVAYTFQQGGHTVSNAKIENFGNDWYRISAVFTGNAGQFFALGLVTADSLWSSGTAFNNLYLGDVTKGVYAFGAQVEQGSYPTSYIKTEGYIETRLKDECINGGSSSLFDIIEGTFFVDVTPFKASTFSRISLSNGTSDEEIIYLFRNNNSQVTIISENSGVSQVSYTANITFDTRNKLAFTFKNNEFKFYVNGSLEHTDTSGTITEDLNALYFAGNNGTFNFFQGKVHDTRVYDRVLTEAEAIELTTL